MIRKYKMMSLAAAACTLLGMGASEAAVTLTFAQVGGDVTATWSGTYNLSGGLDDFDFDVFAGLGNDRAAAASGAYGYSGVLGSSFPSGLALASGTYVGDPFGFFSGGRMVGPPFGSGDYSPLGVMTFSGTTLLDLGASSFSNFLAFEGFGNVGGNRQILFNTGSVSAIPEVGTPVATALLFCSGLLIRSRKRAVQ